MKIEVEYYGMIAERLNLKSESLEFVSEENIRSFFENKYPTLKNLSYKIAVNNELTETVDTSLESIKIALLPPFAVG